MNLPETEIEALVDQVDEERLVDRLAKMIAIPSVNPFDEPASEQCRELEFAEAYTDWMNDAGLEISSREVVEHRPNIWGRRRGSESLRCVMLAGHMDTVGIDGYVEPFNPKIENRRLYGRGACDMKAAMAAYIEVATILEKENIKLKGDLLLSGVVDEENRMIGSKEIRVNGPIPDFAIVGEPTELEVCHAHKGQLCMHVTTRGRACHSSVPELGINAIDYMADVLYAIREFSRELAERDPHPVCGRGRINPGVIKGGSISSSVPDWCELEIDRRYVPGEDLHSILDEFHELLERIKAGNPDFDYEIGPPTIDNLPLETSRDSEVVTSIVGAIESLGNGSAKLGSLGGSTDAPNFLCPAVICGPGSINQAHTLDEYVEIEQLVDAAKVYLRTAVKMLG